MPQAPHTSLSAPAPGTSARRPLLAWALVVLAFGALFGLAPGELDAAGPPPARAAQALRPGP